MVGSSKAMHAAFERIRSYAPYHVPVLITGESGTGKELAAGAIHERSDYADGPFVAINCGALPNELVASELFGHERGAFTGALAQHIGYFERAHGGTLFLDEIAQLPSDVQSTLLRVLQEGTFRRVGGQQTISVDVRVVAATNSDLEAAVNNGTFRDDLFFRLNVLRLHLPPLRERAGDIRLMANYFARQLADEMGVDRPIITAEALDALEAHRWPGNVRELVSAIRRALVLADGEITRDHLDLGTDSKSPAADWSGGEPRPTSRRGDPSAPMASDPNMVDSDITRPEAIRHMLSACGGNVTEAARRMGVSRVTLYRRMRKYGLQRKSA
jgi:DNA-binding NtrC family response regulator